MRAEHRVRHGEQHDEQRDGEHGQRVLHEPRDARGREQSDETSFQHAFAEQARLQRRSVAGRLRDLEQEVAVQRGIAERGYDTIIAIYFNGQAQSAQLPPQRHVPWRENQCQRCQKQQVCVMRAAMVYPATELSREAPRA